MQIQNNDAIEFYDGTYLIAQLRSSMVPKAGEKITILMEEWIVKSIIYSMYYPNNNYGERGMLAKVSLVPAA